MRKEEWLPVVGYEGIYEVSNRGRVRRITEQHSGIKKLTISSVSNGRYHQTGLTKDRKKRIVNVHILVAEAFIGPRPDIWQRMHINHKNGIKTDNRVENLEYVTPSVNMQHAIDNNLTTRPAGEKHCKVKVPDSIVLEIRKRVKRGERQIDLSREYDISPYTISHWIKNRNRLMP